MKNKIIFKTLMLKGEAGSTIVSMEKTGHVGTADIYTITFNDGSTTEISLENMSAITSVEKTSSTDTEDIYTITCADGSTQTFSVLNHNADIAAMSDDIDTIDARVDNFINSVVPNTVETLWTGSIKDVGDSATLSKAVSNFDFIDLYLLGSADSKYIRVPATQTAVEIQQQNLSDNASSNFLRLWEMGVSISGTTVSITKSIAWAWDDPDNSNPTVTANAQNSLPITRIDGVKVASDTPAEVTDIRVGADGTTYNSAGAAVRGQISGLNEDIDVTTPTYTATDGKYITAYGSVSSASGFAYSEPIQVYKGSKVTLKGKGYSNNVAMISLCDSAGSYHSPVVVCPDSTVRTYEYTCIADGYVAISYSTAVTPVLTIGGENSNSVIGTKVRQLVSFTGEKDEESNAVPQIYSAGHYITKNGANTAYSDFNIYGVISLNRGDMISVRAKGYLDNVGIIAKVLNGTFTAVVNSIDSTERTYTYTADSNCDVVISSNKSTSVIYTVDRKTIPESLDELYSNLPALQSELCNLSLFEKFGVVGDSFASGELYFNSSYHDKYNISWGQIMARKHGTICTNYSSGGLHTRSWLTANKGLPLLLSSDPEDIYYLALGINDVYSLGIDYLGSITDITSHESYDDYGDTFYGNYGRIIEQILEHAPHAKIVMFTCASTTGNYPAFNNAIIEIAEHYNIPYIVQADDPFFHSTIYTNMSGSHPTAIGYSGMAVAFERLLNKCIVNNQNYFFDLYMYD